ncbi:MAG: hypothetical protein ACKO6E_09160, partial [Planctomycetota bacterium]
HDRRADRRPARHLQLKPRAAARPGRVAAAGFDPAPAGDAPFMPATRRASGTLCARSRFERPVTGRRRQSGGDILAAPS